MSGYEIKRSVETRWYDLTNLPKTNAEFSAFVFLFIHLREEANYSILTGIDVAAHIARNMEEDGHG